MYDWFLHGWGSQFLLFCVAPSPVPIRASGSSVKSSNSRYGLRPQIPLPVENSQQSEIGAGLMGFQQFGGINGICFYVSSIFESAGFPSDIGTIIYACIQVVITGLGAFIIDRAGRKPLLLASASGLVLGCLITGLSFYLKNYEIAVKAACAFAVTGILVYIGSFSISL